MVGSKIAGKINFGCARPTTYYPLLTTNFGVRSDPGRVTDHTRLGS
jgi:hypothetical protein